MKALSIRQPGVWAILHAGKDLQNRAWTSKHRGWIALHASKEPQKSPRLPRGIRPPDLKALDYSAICGVARLIDVVPGSSRKQPSRQPDRLRQYGWVLADAARLPEPIACKGRRRLWDVPPHVLRQIRRQLPRLDL